MATTDNEIPAPIIVKKVIKGGGGHHGGAWKVAYADFVTAMMAFFLLMWLLNMTTKEQKNAISNYFDPTHPVVSSELSGSGGILGGMTMSPDGAQVSNVQDIAAPASPTTPRSGMAMGDQEDHLGTSDYEGDSYDLEVQGKIASDTDLSATGDGDNNMTDGINILDEIKNIDQNELEQMRALIEASENQDFESVKQAILDDIKKDPKIAELLDHLMIDITPEGLRIQIVDKDGRSMFPVGKADMHDFMRELLHSVTQIIIPQSNQISVRGHTDGKQYTKGAKYNNWNLSSDRALASRQAILESGLQYEKIENVMGRADKEHLLPDEPLSARNRRITIILLRQKLKNADQIHKAAAVAVKKAIAEKQAKEEQNKPKEDREDIPKLDQVIEGSTMFIIENGGTPIHGTNIEVEEKPTDIVDEIKKFKDNKGSSDGHAPSTITLPEPQQPIKKDPQVLQF